MQAHSVAKIYDDFGIAVNFLGTPGASICWLVSTGDNMLSSVSRVKGFRAFSRSSLPTALVPGHELELGRGRPQSRRIDVWGEVISLVMDAPRRPGVMLEIGGHA